MNLSYRLVTGTIKGLTYLLSRIDAEQLERVPEKGPLILVANHVNFLEVAIMYTQLHTRPITGYVKSEHWDNWYGQFLFDLWDGIPLRRGEADLSAVKEGLAALAAGKILAIAPEGTRTGDGRLQKGHSGAVIVALKSGAPIMPVAYYGHETFWHDIRRLRRTEFHVQVGRPFYLDAGQKRPTKAMREQMTTEIMYRLATLLPPPYRGHYADLENATEKYLRFA